jgi:hypothetical protein
MSRRAAVVQIWSVRAFGFAKDSKGLVVEDTQRETDKNQCQSGKAFEICDIPDGRGGCAEGFVL